MLKLQASPVSVFLLALMVVGLSVMVYFTSREVLLSAASTSSSHESEYIFYVPPIINEVFQSEYYLVFTVYNPNDKEINISDARVFFYSESGELVGVSEFNLFVGPKEVNKVRVPIPLLSLPASDTYKLKIEAGPFLLTSKVNIKVERDVSILDVVVEPALVLDGYYDGVLFFSSDSNINISVLSDVNRVYVTTTLSNSLPYDVPVSVSVYGPCIDTVSVNTEIPPGISTLTLNTSTTSGGTCPITAEVEFSFDTDTSNNSHSIQIPVWYVYGCDSNTECAADVSSACQEEFNAAVVLTSDLTTGIRLENLTCSGKVVLEGNVHSVRDNNTALYLSNVKGIRVRNVSLFGGNYALYSEGSSFVIEQNLSRSSFTFLGSKASFSVDANSNVVLECSGDCSGSKNFFYTYFEGNINYVSFLRAVAPPISDFDYVTVLLFSGFDSPKYNYAAPLDVNSSYPPPDFNTVDLIAKGQLDTSCSALRFKDVRGREINYWVEAPTCNSWNTRIYVKLIELPVYGMPVFMFHENNSDVPSLSNGGGTFLFFDDFENNVNVTWTDVDTDNDGMGELTWSEDFDVVTPYSLWDGNYAVKKGANFWEDVYIDGGRKPLPFTITRPFIIEVEIYVPEADDGQPTNYYRDGFGVLLEENGYGATLGHGSTAVERFYELKDTTYVVLYDASSVAATNQWYYKAFILDVDVLGGLAFTEDGNQIYYYVGVNENNYTSFNAVFLSGGDYVFYDNLRIRQYPGPHMEVLRTLFYG